MAEKTPNHFLTKMKCPVNLEDVDLFSPGAQEHWYDAYPILHRESPVHCLPGEGLSPEQDAYILTKHEDISAVVRDPERFPPLMSAAIRELAESGVEPETLANVNAMTASMVTLLSLIHI